jgi:hypothetical protein
MNTGIISNHPRGLDVGVDVYASAGTFKSDLSHQCHRKRSQRIIQGQIQNILPFDAVQTQMNHWFCDGTSGMCCFN